MLAKAALDYAQKTRINRTTSIKSLDQRDPLNERYNEKLARITEVIKAVDRCKLPKQHKTFLMSLVVQSLLIAFLAKINAPWYPYAAAVAAPVIACILIRR